MEGGEDIDRKYSGIFALWNNFSFWDLSVSSLFRDSDDIERMV